MASMMEQAAGNGRVVPTAHALPRAGASPRRRVALLVTLQMVLLGLLLTTVLAVGAVDYVSSRQTTEELGLQLIGAGARTVASEVEASFQPSLIALRELKMRLEFERAPIDDRMALGLMLADRLRYEHSINRLAFLDQAEGGAAAAYRDDESRIIQMRMDPALDAGQLVTWVVRGDGALAPYPVAVPRFDARQRTYYAPAVNTAELVWTGPEAAADGIPVMNASLAVREPTTRAVLGVLLAQVFLDELPATLHQAVGQQPGAQAFLFTRQGQLLATAHSTSPERLVALNAALPAPLDALPLLTPVPVRFQHDGVEYAGAIQGFRVAGGLEWFTGLFLPEANLLQSVYERQRRALLAAGVFLLIGLSVGAVMAARIARPLNMIADDLIQVAQFRLSPAPTPQSFVREVAIVSDAVDRMKASLRSFGRYIPADLVREMLAQGQEAHLGGEARLLTIHFSDVEDFTHLSEHRAPTDLVRDLAEYLACMSDTVRAHDGTIDKFIGDGIMAFWNAPNLVPDHAAQACWAALRAQNELETLRVRWDAAGQPLFRARIGLHTGEVVVGNFGTEQRFAYTAMGDAVNLASRLEGLNKTYGTYVMASEAVRQAAGPAFEWRRLDRVAVVGRTAGTDVHELLGERGAVAETVLQARDLYEAALAAYFARRFDEAEAGFLAAAAARPDDKAAPMMARRAADLGSYPLPTDWTGVFLSSSK